MFSKLSQMDILFLQELYRASSLETLKAGRAVSFPIRRISGKWKNAWAPVEKPNQSCGIANSICLTCQGVFWIVFFELPFASWKDPHKLYHEHVPLMKGALKAWFRSEQQ